MATSDELFGVVLEKRARLELDLDTLPGSGLAVDADGRASLVERCVHSRRR